MLAVPPSADVRVPSAPLLAQLAALPDPRVDRAKRHSLTDVLAIALLATLCGADTYTQFALFGVTRAAWLATFLALPNGIPSHDTFARVLRQLDPKAFAAWLTTWSQAFAGQVPGVVAIDGKTARRSGDATTAALHTVSAWATEQHLTLGQVATDVKSNEITAIPELLALLLLRDCIVTIDAIGCQTAIATAIRAKKAHYVLAVKGNQRWLHDRLVALFAHGPEDTVFWARAPHETLTHREKDHGRIETRTYRLVPAAAVLADRAPWTDLQSVGCVDATRHHVSGPKAGTTEHHRRYFITSLPARVAPFAHAVRSHWQVENACHWTLDVVFNEDQNRARRDAGPANLATLRRWALSLMRQDTTQKTGLKGRRLIAGWDPDYLLHLLRIAVPTTDTNS